MWAHVSSKVVLDKRDSQSRLVAWQARVPHRPVPQRKASFLANKWKHLETTVVSQRHRLMWQRGPSEFVAARVYVREKIQNVDFVCRGACVVLPSAHLPGTKTVGPSSAEM